MRSVETVTIVYKDNSSSCYAREVGKQVSTVEPPLLSSNGVFL